MLGCKDAFFSLIDIISEWKGGEPQAPSKETSIASNVDEIEPVDTFEMIEDYVFHSVEKVSTEDEQDWQMNFDSSESREENIRAKVTSYPEAETFQLQTNYLDQLQPILPFEDLEVPRFKYTIKGQALSWMIYEGYDFDPLDQTVSERGSHQAELLLQDLEIGIKIYPSTSLLTKLLDVSVKEVEILDNVSTSHWRKLLTYQIPGPMDPPRETNSSMLTYRWKGVRSNNNEEFILELGILPLQLYIDQDTFTCLEDFFTREGKGPSAEEMEADKQQTHSSEKMIFFQKIEIEPIVIQLDYKPKRVDIARISHGQLAELFNFLNIDGANIYLKPVRLVGIHGWQRFFSKVSSIWIPHIKNTQIPQVASGVAGIKSVVTLGGGISDLILLPIEQYRKDGRILRGISRGANSFIRAASVESTRIVSRIATGAQTLIETAENGINPSRSSVSKLAEQPKDIIEGAQLGLRALNLSVQDAARTLKRSNTEGGNQAQAVPIALLQPVKGVATAIAQLLVGIHNTLDETQQLRMRNKYKLQ